LNGKPIGTSKTLPTFPQAAFWKNRSGLPLLALSRTFRTMNKEKRQIRCIDLFAGAGGSSCGATSAGIKVVAAIDRWTLARDTFKTNFPEVKFLLESCENVKLRLLKKEVGAVDLIIASPECTSHTCAKGNAPRSEMSRRTAFQVVRFAKEFKPRWIVVENVVHMRSWKSYETWRRQLEDLGYNLRDQVINAADHGVPQARRRLFVMCDRDQAPSEVKASAGRRRTAASVVNRNGLFKFSELRSANRAAATLQRAERAFETVGSSKPFLLVYYGSDAAGGWQRLDVPLRTLTTLDRFALVRPTRNGHEMRMLQVPEIRAAMGFPAEYVLKHGTRREKIKLLGNAVCPPVMAAVIRTLTSPKGRHENS
jgi:DNA (cytosine-5)-methyltransferase 1